MSDHLQISTNDTKPDLLPQVQCPIQKTYYDPPYPLERLQEMAEQLKELSRASTPLEAPLEDPLEDPLESSFAGLARQVASQPDAHRFTQGTLRRDGVLDCCKQSFGVTGLETLKPSLSGHPMINGVLLGTNGLGDAGAHEVAEIIESQPQLKTVYLGCNYITAEGVGRLAQALEGHQRVESLWLKRNPIGDAGVERLLEVFRRGTSIRALDLIHTGITLVGVEALCAGLIKAGHQLSHLLLGGNQLGPDVIIPLARLMRALPLRCLSLSVSLIGEVGASRLAEVLRDDQTLENLDLSTCALSDHASARLIESVAHHPKLNYLNLGYARSSLALTGEPNRLGGATVRALCAYLSANPPLKTLNLTRAQFSPIEVQRLIDSLEENTQLHQLILPARALSRVGDHLDSILARNHELTAAPPQDPFFSAIRSAYR